MHKARKKFIPYYLFIGKIKSEKKERKKNALHQQFKASEILHLPSNHERRKVGSVYSQKYDCKHRPNVRHKSSGKTARRINVYSSLKQYSPHQPIGTEQWKPIWHIRLQCKFHIETAWREPLKEEYHKSCRLNRNNSHLYAFSLVLFWMGNTYNFSWFVWPT